MEASSQWWKSGVVYQIYPASFKDSNGDGVGDLQGIISKLDYIKNLGIDIIWICPMYDSPQVDMGYDISNYEAVYPPYGTVSDMETLIAESHKRDIRVMLDLVINHTSDRHQWFMESKSSLVDPKRDWYIWRKPQFNTDGTRRPPNNWRSNFGGGSVWEWDPATEEYYMHLFTKEQPDLNWENPEARKAIYASAIEFWLQRGVDGFRVDTVNMYSKPPNMPDAPITDPESEFQRGSSLYCNGPRIHEYVGEINAILRKYGAITVGELPHTPTKEGVLRYVSAKAKQLDMVFQFDVVDLGWGTKHHYDTHPRNWELPQLKRAVARTQDLMRDSDGWSTVFMENHDQARSISRFGSDLAQFRVASGRMLALLQTTLSGTLYIYQGQEIGAINAPGDSYPVTKYKDVDSTSYYKMLQESVDCTPDKLERATTALQHLARDHSRIPMSWDGNKLHGGFGKGSDQDGEPWMATHPLAAEINVAKQMDDPNSVLAFWKQMLRLRKAHEDLLVYGEFTLLREDDPGVFMYIKSDLRTQRCLVVLNIGSEEREWEMPSSEELCRNASSEFRVMSSFSTSTGTVEVGERLLPWEGRLYWINQQGSS